MRRKFLLTLSAVLLMVGCGLCVWQIASSPTVLRVAAGPADEEDARVIAAIAATLSREHESLRLKVVPTRNASESARLLDDKQVDLAVVRPDVQAPRTGQTIAILHRDAILLVAPAGRGVARIADLAGRSVGILRGSPANGRILDTLGAFYDLAPGSVTQVGLDGPAAAEAALRSGRVDAVMAVGSSAGRLLAETVAAAVAAGGGQEPTFVAIPEAEAVAARSPVLESQEIVRGAFGGTAARPAESVRTLAVNYRLMASSSLGDATVSELTRLLFTLRPRLASEMPLANRIEAPDTSKSSVLPVHPGASAYFEGEVPTFLDRYEDWLYLGVMVLSIVGSGFAGVASQAAGRRRARTLGLLDQLKDIVPAARSARTASDLDRLDQEADEILGLALERAGAGSLDGAAVAAFGLGLDQARLAIADRRRTVAEGGVRGLLQAAE